MKNIRALLAAAAAAALTAACGANADEIPHAVPASATADAAANGIQTAVLSGGCFWGLQGVFEHVKGVKQVVAGYAGGSAATAQYETVSSGTTGHAETVQIKFDPKLVSYADLLRVYFSVATDPTELNRQGPDDGTQYRGDIWATTPDQARVAKAYIAQLQASHTFSKPIVTRVDAYKGFYPAEAYHQDFLLKNPDYPYIVINDLPKIENLKRMLPHLYVVTPVRLAQNSHS
ncbi:MAG: peptide-methionine (S)-S-oxide reductase MsrA [Proteobacteria bacterium]|nr:peptide-methionine (S)-S-oxide reductase MsrA [Pseudomonadota bacterium]